MKEIASEPPDTIHLSRVLARHVSLVSGKVFSFTRSNSLKLPKRLKRLVWSWSSWSVVFAHG